jgi:nucleotide-binding universal stress UspA family protein
MARSTARLKFAVELAAEHKAHLVALYSVDLPSPVLFMGDSSIVDVQFADDLLARARDQGNAAARIMEQSFLDATRQNDVAGEWRVAEDLATDVVPIHARYADIVIVGQTDPDHPAHNGGRIPETVLLSCGRPVLVIPYVESIASLGQTVLVDWKSGREAARAVNDAIPLLRNARTVTVLAIDPDHGVSGDGDVPAADIALHLARHDINATAAHTQSDGISDGDVLLNSATDRGADLIVVGAYGHSRVSEFVFGGVTRTLLSDMTVPILFSH